MTDREEVLEKMLRSLSRELDRTMSCLKTMFSELQELVEENEDLRSQLAKQEKEISCPPCNGDCNEGRDCPARKREWVGLTDEEVGMLTVADGLHDVEVPILADLIRAVEAKLKEKNT
jgi:hypothetical protein